MIRILASLILTIWCMALPAFAQQQVFIQIEAQPSLAQAQQSLRSYARRFQDLNGFSLGTGWYGIALGPYSEIEATAILRNLRNAQLIPRDSYIARDADYRSQFWPVGTNLLPRTSLPDLPQTNLPDSTPNVPDETLREARAGEARLSREDRAALQKALEWAGFYRGAIDASFGPGTRAAMSNWQEANFLAATGVLTTRQRADLMRKFNAVLDGLDLTQIDDAETGIAMRLPLGVVAFSRYEAPFAHYEASGDLAAQVLLISQSGTRATLAGLYDVLQTLEAVPLTGPRKLNADSFTLIGEGPQRVTHIEATLKDGQIKGFALIWPANDEDRRARVLQIMQDSFARRDGVLDPARGTETAPRIDLVAGLEIRQPLRVRSGFFVDPRGWVITSTEAVTGCTRITLDDGMEASSEVLAEDTGVALLRPAGTLAPPAVATFLTEPPRLRSEVAVAGYSYGGVLGAPSVTFGTLADLKGLEGEPDLKRLALNTLDSDVGGPVVDDGGAVLGMLLPSVQNDRRLPDGVTFAAGSNAIRAVLNEAGIRAKDADPGTALPPETLGRRAASITVLVSCWQ